MLKGTGIFGAWSLPAIGTEQIQTAFDTTLRTDTPAEVFLFTKWASLHLHLLVEIIAVDNIKTRLVKVDKVMTLFTPIFMIVLFPFLPVFRHKFASFPVTVELIERLNCLFAFFWVERTLIFELYLFALDQLKGFGALVWALVWVHFDAFHALFAKQILAGS